MGIMRCTRPVTSVSNGFTNEDVCGLIVDEVGADNGPAWVVAVSGSRGYVKRFGSRVGEPGDQGWPLWLSCSTYRPVWGPGFSPISAVSRAKYLPLLWLPLPFRSCGTQVTASMLPPSPTLQPFQGCRSP